MPQVQVYPSPKKKNVPLNDSFDRKNSPATGKPYARAVSGCLPGGAGHGGIDVKGAIGDPAVACIGGKIRTATGGSFGNQITIMAPDENGKYTSQSHGFFYAHLSQILVSNGKVVKAGDLIGLIGKTGSATGPHIHFEHRTRWDNWCTAINCFKELEAARKGPQAVTVTVNGKKINKMIPVWFDMQGVPVIAARPFLTALKLNGKKCVYEYIASPDRLVFSTPAGVNDVPLTLVNRLGVAEIGTLMASVDATAVVTASNATKSVGIKSALLSL